MRDHTRCFKQTLPAVDVRPDQFNVMSGWILRLAGLDAVQFRPVSLPAPPQLDEGRRWNIIEPALGWTRSGLEIKKYLEVLHDHWRGEQEPLGGFAFEPSQQIYLGLFFNAFRNHLEPQISCQGDDGSNNFIIVPVGSISQHYRSRRKQSYFQV